MHCEEVVERCVRNSAGWTFVIDEFRQLHIVTAYRELLPIRQTRPFTVDCSACLMLGPPFVCCSSNRAGRDKCRDTNRTNQGQIRCQVDPISTRRVIQLSHALTHISPKDLLGEDAGGLRPHWRADHAMVELHIPQTPKTLPDQPFHPHSIHSESPSFNRQAKHRETAPLVRTLSVQPDLFPVFPAPITPSHWSPPGHRRSRRGKRASAHARASQSILLR